LFIVKELDITDDPLDRLQIIDGGHSNIGVEGLAHLHVVQHGSVGSCRENEEAAAL
jgi:hypothetical protein